MIFADVVQEANIAHGVARLRMGQVATGGAVASAGTLIVPLQQLPTLVKAFASLIQQLEERARQGNVTANGEATEA